MIKSLTVTNPAGESIRLELTRPEKSGFYIENIEGLGPANATVNITESATVDGGYYTSSHVSTRNIVLTLGFLYEKGIEDMRHESYRYFPLKKQIKLLIETDNRTCVTHGYVESNEPNIFSERETTQISILCPDPYFYAFNNGIGYVTNLSGDIALFSFPFSNESLDEPLIELGQVMDTAVRIVHNPGDVEIGVKIHIYVKGSISSISIANRTTDQTMRIDTDRLKQITSADLKEGDEIVINTKKGDKSIYLISDGVKTNILNCLSRFTDWIYLLPGDNQIFPAASDPANMDVTMEQEVMYAGV